MPGNVSLSPAAFRIGVYLCREKIAIFLKIFLAKYVLIGKIMETGRPLGVAGFGGF